RARPRPGDQCLGRGDEKALVGEFLVNGAEERVVRADRLAGRWVDDALRLRGDERTGGRSGGHGRAQSHSSAPFFHSYIKPMVSTPRNTIIDQKPSIPISPKDTAHGNRKATSRSKMMK